MKFAIVAVLAVLVACTMARPEETTYTTKYDGVDIDEILRSDRLFNNYFKCMMEKGKCTPDGSELRRVLPDALKTNCSKCSQKQRDGSDKVLKFLIEKKASQYEELAKKYDSEGVYLAAYKARAGTA